MSRRSTSISSSDDGDGDRQRHAVGHALEGVVACVHRESPVGQSPDRLGHPALAVVEPRRHERVEAIPSHLTRELCHLPLADAGRTKQREVVALPLDRDADAHLAHADDVVDVLVVALHLDARQDDRALLVDISRHRGVGRRLGVPDVREVGLAEQREAVFALVVEHGHEDAHVGRVGVAVVGRVVHERIALTELRVKLLHALRHQVRAAEHVHGDALGEAEELVVSGDDAAGEIAAGVEDHRTPGADQRVGHTAHDRGEAAREHGQVDRVEAGVCDFRCHISPWNWPRGAARCSDIESTGVSVGSVTTSTRAGPAVGAGSPQRLVELLRRAHSPGRHPEALCHLREVHIGEIDRHVVIERELLNVLDPRERAVVEDHGRDGQLQPPHDLQLGNRVRERAVAGEEHRATRQAQLAACHRSADSRRGAPPDARQAARRERLPARAPDRHVVRGPARHQACVCHDRIVPRGVRGDGRGDPLRPQPGLRCIERRLALSRDPRRKLGAARADAPVDHRRSGQLQLGQ